MSNAAIYYNDAGTWRCAATGVHYKDGSTWRTATNVYYNDGGTWREVHRVYQQGDTISDSVSGEAGNAQFSWNNSGQLILADHTGVIATRNWLWPAGTAPTVGEYYIRHTLLSGTTPTSANPTVNGTTVALLSSGTTRFIANAAAAPGTVTSTVLTEIATGSTFDSTTIVSAATFVITVTRS